MFLGESIPVVGNVLHLTFLYNTGAAFSILRNQIWLLASLAIIASIALVYFYPRIIVFGNYMQWGATLLLGGTVGNLIDRLLYGSVIDFIDFRIWPVFNVADSAICIGATLVAFSLLRKKEYEEKDENA
jgi:signal peptidase II